MRIGALLLAAGGATRFGSPKLCAEINGEPVISHSLKALSPVFVDNIYCVLGSDAALIRRHVEGNCHLLHHTAWQSGIGSSISFGIRSMTEQHHWDGIAIALADQVRLTTKHYRELVANFDGSRAVAAYYAGIAGVPAIFPPDWFDRLISLDGDRGAAGLLRAHGVDIARIPMPAAEFDIDRPDDIESSELSA